MPGQTRPQTGCYSNWATGSVCCCCGRWAAQGDAPMRTRSHRIPVRESESQSGPRAIAGRVSATFTWRQQTCDNAFAFDPLLTPLPPLLLSCTSDQQTKPDARQVRIDWHWLRGYPRAICCHPCSVLPCSSASHTHTHTH